MVVVCASQKGKRDVHPTFSLGPWWIERYKNSNSEKCISPDIWKTLNPDPNTSDIPKDTNPNLELGKELNQVLASFGISNSDADEAWNMVKERASND